MKIPIDREVLGRVVEQMRPSPYWWGDDLESLRAALALEPAAPLMRAEVDARDAARYRWLRDKAKRIRTRNLDRLHRGEILVLHCLERGESDILHGVALDNAIDAAMPAPPVSEARNGLAAALPRTPEAVGEVHADLMGIALSIEALKRECGADPDSPQAVRNSRYMGIAYRVRALASSPRLLEALGGRV